jgi:hypothetical protein
MATRRTDLEENLGRPKSVHAERAKAEADKRIPSKTLQRASPAASSSIDPSPFSGTGRASDNSESRAIRIQRVAYHRAEQRGFAPGAELEDWLAAEREIDGQGSSG